ncbi:MAG: pitrilysin family protein [Actinomycetaceae bacterium]|nr:pitrilysin family protein [Actinomycetaceae bacterium]
MTVTPYDLPHVTYTDTLAHITIPEGETQIHRSVLPGGIRVITQQVPATRSVAIGMWFAVGSRDEHSGHYGSTHYLEHLLFKGTKRFSAIDIARSFDEVGGDTNATTAKEYTHYYAHVLGENVPMAIDVLMDMVTAPRLSAEDFDTERTVILEELAMSADDPSDVAHESWAGQVFYNQDLGRPVGGTKATVLATPREAVIEHYRKTYSSQTLVVSASGAVDHEQVCELVLEHARDNGWDTTSESAPQPVRQGKELDLTEAMNRRIERDWSQAHILVGSRSFSATDERRPAMSLLLTILGGGMSSRLFQEVREKRGLAYTTYAFDSAYSDSGAFAMYAGCTPDNAAEVERVMLGELEGIASGNISEDEVARACGQLRGGIALDMEVNGARMSRLGRSEIVRGEIYTIDQVLQRLREVRPEDISSVAQLLMERPRVRTYVGPAVTQ